MKTTAPIAQCDCHPAFHALGLHDRDGVVHGAAPRLSGPSWLQVLAELLR